MLFWAFPQSLKTYKKGWLFDVKFQKSSYETGYTATPQQYILQVCGVEGCLVVFTDNIVAQPDQMSFSLGVVAQPAQHLEPL